MPTNKDIRQAAAALRKIVTETVGLPDNGPRDGGLRDRLELAADVLVATGRDSENGDTG